MYDMVYNFLEEELTNAEATSEDQERKSATPDDVTSVKDGEEFKETEIGERKITYISLSKNEFRKWQYFLTP